MTLNIHFIVLNISYLKNYFSALKYVRYIASKKPWRTLNYTYQLRLKLANVRF